MKAFLPAYKLVSILVATRRAEQRKVMTTRSTTNEPVKSIGKPDVEGLAPLPLSARVAQLRRCAAQPTLLGTVDVIVTPLIWCKLLRAATWLGRRPEHLQRCVATQGARDKQCDCMSATLVQVYV